MPVHDWTKVDDGVFHDFHLSWLIEIKRALMRGLLPPGYYVMAEQVGGDLGTPDVLTLQAAGSEASPGGSLPGIATLTQSPPPVLIRARIARDTYARKQRTLVIRHRSNDRIVALIEVLSRGNKSSQHAIRTLLNKVVAALDAGIHVLLIDVHPPGPRDENGVHGAVLGEIGDHDYALPLGKPLTAVSYAGGANVVDALLAHYAVGDAIPDMPLFLTNEHFIYVPVEAAYMTAFEDVNPQHQAAVSVRQTPTG
jgi:hypothetical protein